MYQIAFSAVHSYSSDREGISVPVVLKAGGHSVRLAASIDTGATFCLFRNELAEALGLNLANAAVKRFRTANSSFEAFGHEVEIAVLGVATFATVYFFADASINKNVLGRVGWLDRVRLGLVDHDTIRRYILRRTMPNESSTGLAGRKRRGLSQSGSRVERGSKSCAGATARRG